MTTVSDLEALIRDEIEAALGQPDHSLRMTELRDAAAIAFAMAYDDANGPADRYQRAEHEFLNTLNAAAAHTFPDGSVEQTDRVTNVFATAAANGAIVAAAEPGQEFQWITMLDDRVREAHVPLHGEVRAAGVPFIVAGLPLMYPGQPVGPPDVWINCRCTLHAPVALASALPVVDDQEGDAAGAACPPPAASPHLCPGEDRMPIEQLLAASDKPWGQFSASDYSIEQWRRACLLKMPGGDPDAKSTYKLPVREPGGALNVNGVHAAAAALGGARGGVSAPPEAIDSARRKLRGLYRQIGETPPDSLKADATETLTAWGPSTSPPGTHDAPGWLTHPRETQRLRDYWTKGAGAAKIGWGSPGDLTRCARHLRKYVGAFAWGTCQNLHKTALGYWNPESRPGHRHATAGDLVASAEDDTSPETLAMIDAAFAAAAELEDDPMMMYPKEWFEDPGFDGPTPLTITSDGRVLGHLASWDTCHVGITGECVKPPRSATNYAHFRTGEVETREGELVAVGQITMDTGHAEKGDGPLAAVSHYDNTGTGVADVAAGEDDYGIWVAGAMRPGVSEQQMYVLKATGALSGDWRRIGGNLELVAALAVNVPGFPVPRLQMAASAGRTMSLVAAAIVGIDPNADSSDRVALAVIARLDQREADAARRQRASALAKQIHDMRCEALVTASTGA